MSAPIDTSKVTDRRPLRFHSITDVLADIERVVAADQAGRLRRTGNWTAGQVMGHLASWIEYGYIGFPMKPPPFFIRWLLKIKAKSYMRDGLPGGVHIPGAPGGTYGTEPMSTDEGAQRLRKALGRLAAGDLARFDSPGFGPMSHEQRVAFQLRHAELHLSYLHP